MAAKRQQTNFLMARSCSKGGHIRQLLCDDALNRCTTIQHENATPTFGKILGNGLVLCFVGANVAIFEVVLGLLIHLELAF